MWPVLILAGIAAAAASGPGKCPVTGVTLTDAQLADPALRVGDKTFCCKNCVREWIGRGRAA